jgi:hypothetical protein
MLGKNTPAFFAAASRRVADEEKKDLLTSTPDIVRLRGREVERRVSARWIRRRDPGVNLIKLFTAEICEFL